MKLSQLASLSLIAAFCSTPVAEAADVSKGSTKASEKLLGNPPPANLKASVAGPGKVDCQSNEAKCGPVPVHVWYDPDQKKCLLYIYYGDINVPKSTLSGSRKIVVTWELSPKDVGTYKFTDDGINIVDNDQTKDWYPKGHPSAKVFTWGSVHKQTHTSDYTINVMRKHPQSGAWDNCDPADPRINNT